MGKSGVASHMSLYLREIHKFPLLSAPEERELALAIIEQGCPAARDKLVRSNLRLVIAIAKKFGNRGLSLPDLIEEGNVGLIKAVENFDPDQGARFGTYASWWIKQSIKRSLINAVQPIHVPAYMVDLISKWRRATRELEDLLGRTPTTQELADAMELPTKKIKAIRNAVHAFKRPSQSGGPDGESLTLAELVTDERTPGPDESTINTDQIATVLELLENMDERDAAILRMRYGLDGDDPMTFKEIGDAIGLTRERVRQIEIEALAKMHRRMHPDATETPNPVANGRRTIPRNVPKRPKRSKLQSA